ncbi:MAG TPA: hypothetical protein VF127_04675 [Nitrospira sp.]
MRQAGRVVAVCVTLLAGCATTGQKVDVVIPTASTGGAASTGSGSGPRVVVKPFDDARMDRTHLGSRSHFWGDTSYFDLPKGTVGDAVAKALVQQLNKRGWQASLEGSNGTAADATITGTIQDLSVTAVSRFGRTELAAKNTMMVRVLNHGDESTVQERVLGSGSDEVFWFDPEDAQQLVNEVLEKNIEKFIADTKVEGKTVKLK